MLPSCTCQPEIFLHLYHTKILYNLDPISISVDVLDSKQIEKTQALKWRASAKLTETYNRRISEQNGIFLLSVYDQLQQPIEDHIRSKELRNKQSWSIMNKNHKHQQSHFPFNIKHQTHLTRNLDNLQLNNLCIPSHCKKT